jgi:hypothetical protein
VDGQPPLGVVGAVLVFLAGLEGVFDRCLSPDLARHEVDAAAGVEWVAFEDVGQFVEVDGQGPQHRRRAAAELSFELVGQVSIPGPASVSERKNEIATQFGRSFNALHDGGDHAVAGELESVSVGTGVSQQVDDGRSVTPVYGPPQGGSLLL